MIHDVKLVPHTTINSLDLYLVRIIPLQPCVLRCHLLEVAAQLLCHLLSNFHQSTSNRRRLDGLRVLNRLPAEHTNGRVPRGETARHAVVTGVRVALLRRAASHNGDYGVKTIVADVYIVLRVKACRVIRDSIELKYFSSTIRRRRICYFQQGNAQQPGSEACCNVRVRRSSRMRHFSQLRHRKTGVPLPYFSKSGSLSVSPQKQTRQRCADRKVEKHVDVSTKTLDRVDVQIAVCSTTVCGRKVSIIVERIKNRDGRTLTSQRGKGCCLSPPWDS